MLKESTSSSREPLLTSELQDALNYDINILIKRLQHENLYFCWSRHNQQFYLCKFRLSLCRDQNSLHEWIVYISSPQ
jgi:hypothetical protein